MKVAEACQKLKDLLAGSAFDPQAPDPRIALSAFRVFMRDPAEGAGDAVLFQCGVDKFTGEPKSHPGSVRQFDIDDEDGEYDRLEHLDCKFTCLPDDELNGL